MAGPSDPASTFLHNVVPWTSYVSIEAYEWVPVPGTMPEEARGTLKRKGSRACRDLNEALNYVRWQEREGREVYFRTAAMRQPGVAKVDKRGLTYYTSLGSDAANAALQQGFHVDVDVKPKAHASLQEGQAAVMAMCHAIGLPRPSLIVYSGGGGFHAHWVLKTAIATAQWRPLAYALAAACRAHGVHADHNLTVNPVCLLRVPGTSNRKYGAPRPVMLEPSMGPAIDIDTIIAALTPFLAPPGNPSGTTTYPRLDDSPELRDFPRLTPVDLADEWTEGVSVTTPYTLEEVAQGCPLVRQALATGGKDHENPLWFMLGHLCTFTEGGLKDFHRLGNQHEDYVPADTDKRYDEILVKKVKDDLGWPRCVTMENFGAAECKACPHRGQGKSPLNFAVRARISQPPVTPPGNPQAPVETVDKKVVDVVGYSVDPVSGIYSREVKVDDVPTMMPVWDNPMWNLDYRRDYLGRFFILFDTMENTLVPVSVVLPTANLVDVQSMRRCLVDKYGCGLNPKEQGALFGFMADFITQMRRTRDYTNKQELMGWSEENGKVAAFIYGPTKFNCAGNTRFNQTDPMIREMYFPTGTADAWKAAVAMINAEKRPEMDLLVATAFGAPLMKFASEKGVVISAWSSGSAHHKTSAIRVGQAVWGSAMGINQLTDTLGSVIERIGLIRVMPSYFDEMKSTDRIKQFAAMIYQFSGGRGKGRLNRNAELKGISTWETLLVGVSNESLVDMVARNDKVTEAGVNRIFEFEVGAPTPGVGQISTADAGTILKNLEANYGHAGQIYAEHLGKSVGTLPQMVHDMTKYLEGVLKASNDERYWLSAAAVLLVGAQLANNLNLTRFDVGRMSDFIAQTFTNMRLTRMRAGVNISHSDNLFLILSAFINSDRRGVLATDIVGSPGKGGPDVAVFNLDDVRYTTELKARYIEEPTPVLRLSRRALINWLTKQEIPATSIINRVMKQFNAKEIRSVLGTGTDRKSGSPEKLIELDLTRSDLAGLYTWNK